jgi:hypothetical protein
MQIYFRLPDERRYLIFLLPYMYEAQGSQIHRISVRFGRIG